MNFPTADERAALQKIYDAHFVFQTPDGLIQFNFARGRFYNKFGPIENLDTLIAQGWLKISEEQFDKKNMKRLNFTEDGLLALEPDIQSRMADVLNRIAVLGNHALLIEAFEAAEPDDEDGVFTQFGSWKARVYRNALTDRLKKEGWLKNG